jgi:hypothetical protein
MRWWRHDWQDGGAKLWRIEQDRTWLHDQKARGLTGLHGQQAELCLILIKEMMDQVGAYGPHP